MKRFVLIQLLSFILICLFCLSDAMAIGLGFTPFTHFSSGDLDWKVDYESDDWGGDFSFEFDDDSKHQGFEFVLDTAVARNTVFNYRLNLGFEKFESKNEDKEMDSITVDNTFGFAVLRTKVVRLWLGPQLRFSYSHGDNDDCETNLIGFGIAPVIGLNLNFGNVVTPAFTIGYRIIRYEGTETYKVKETETYWYSDYYGSWYEEYEYETEYDYDVSLDERAFFFNFSIIFRIRDMF